MKKPKKEGVTGHSSNQTASEIAQKKANELISRLGPDIEKLILALKEKDAVHIPVSIFSNTKLSGLELVCKYLKEELNMHFREISRLLNRDYGTVWTSYSIADRKQRTRLMIVAGGHSFPVSALANRKLSVLESIVSYLKDSLGLRFSEIATELHRDQRNVWTVYRRAKKKVGTENAKE